MSSRRRKPVDPQELSRRRAERAANESEITRLRAIGATVKLDPSRRIVTAYRASPFVKLRDSRTITASQANAAEWLCAQWAVWKGLDGRPTSDAFTPHDHTHRGADLVTSRMLTARRRVWDVLGKLGPMDRDLLCALMAATVERDEPCRWRDIVRTVCGVTQTIRQSQVVACALENLHRVHGAGWRAQLH
jgi:hypothetical protein